MSLLDSIRVYPVHKTPLIIYTMYVFIVLTYVSYIFPVDNGESFKSNLKP